MLPPRTFVLKFVHCLLITLIVLESFVPTLVLATPVVRIITDPFPQQEEPNAKASAAEPPVELIDRPRPAIQQPAPIGISMMAAQTVIHPGEAVTLSLSAWRVSNTSIAGLKLALLLPPELQLMQDDPALEWALPELGASEMFTRSIRMRLADGAAPNEQGIVNVTAQTVATAQFAAVTQTVRLGVEALAGEVQAAAITQTWLGAKGALLRGTGNHVTLFIDAATAPADTLFQYTDLYQWRPPAALTSTPIHETTSPPVAGELNSSDPISPSQGLPICAHYAQPHHRNRSSRQHAQDSGYRNMDADYA